MTAPRRLLGALALATALLVPAAAAQAAPTGVNVPHLSATGDPAGGWQDVTDSGTRTIRSFAQWSILRGDGREFEMNKFRQFADKAHARGIRVLITVTGDASSMATPSAYAAVAADLATQLKGKGVDYEVWNEQDDTTFWLNGPQPGAYTELLKAAYPAIKRADPDANVIVGGLVGNNFEFVEALYAHGAKGSFDGVAVHTDTACLTTDPREYYREPSGRIGRYSFTGYREVRATMLANGDDKPVWMTELGWSTTSAICERGGRAGTKDGGVSQADPGRLPLQGLRLPRQRPMGDAGRVVQPARPADGLDQRRAEPRPDHRLLRPQARLRRLPARRERDADRVRRRHGRRRSRGDDPRPDRRLALPHLDADPRHARPTTRASTTSTSSSTARRSRSRRSRAATAPP